MKRCCISTLLVKNCSGFKIILNLKKVEYSKRDACEVIERYLSRFSSELQRIELQNSIKDRRRGQGGGSGTVCRRQSSSRPWSESGSSTKAIAQRFQTFYLFIFQCNTVYLTSKTLQHSKHTKKKTNRHCRSCLVQKVLELSLVQWLLALLTMNSSTVCLKEKFKTTALQLRTIQNTSHAC